MTRVSSLASLARSIPKWHPTLTRACRVIACPQEHPCPKTCRKCRTRHEGACRDGERVSPCLTCQIGELLPLAQSYTDPGDGLRSPSTEGGSRSKGTHSDPTAVVAVNAADMSDGRPHRAGFTPPQKKEGQTYKVLHEAREDAVGQWRDERSLAAVWAKLSDAEDALRKALSEVDS